MEIKHLGIYSHKRRLSNLSTEIEVKVDEGVVIIKRIHSDS